tara:strand:- start:6342 stop:7862 length:1521 start_codon:yes stop_codon:yes gene_type:complete
MAQRASDLSKKTKSSTTTDEVLIIQNNKTQKTSQFPLDDVFPMLQDGATTSGGKSLGSALGTSATTPLFVGGGFGSSVTGSDKNTLIFKGLRSNDTVIEVKNETLSGDTTKGNIVLDFNQSLLDLSTCNNTSSGFLSTVNLTSNVSNTLPVANGGTNATAFADKAVIITQDSGTDTLAAVAMSTNGQLLIGGSSGPSVATLTAGTNVTITNSDGGIEIASAIGTISSTLDLANNNIDLGTGWLSGDGTAEGINIDSTGKVFIGDGNPTAYFTSELNVDGGISIGKTDGSLATTIVAKPCTSGTTQPFLISGSNASGTGNAGGGILIQAGTGDSNGNGGDTTISGGLRAGSGTDGDVIIKTGSSGSLTTAVTVDEAQNTTLGGHLIITSATDGIVHTGSGTVTQATNHGTSVTLNATSGVITLAGVALAAAAEADFAVTNSTVQTDSVILLTVQSPAAASATNNATLVAQLDEVNNGSFNVRLSNPGAADTSTGAHKIHFLVINNSV